MYRNILIATDGSELAEKAVDHGVAMAEAINAKVTVVTVSEPFRVLAVNPTWFQIRVRRMSDTSPPVRPSALRRQSRLHRSRASPATQFRLSVRIPIRALSIPRPKRVVISSSWPHMAGAGFLPSYWAARPSRY